MGTHIKKHFSLKSFNISLICRSTYTIYVLTYVYAINLSSYEQVCLMGLFQKILLPSLSLIKHDLINLNNHIYIYIILITIYIYIGFSLI